MKTDDLIERLGIELAPVQRLSRPGQRAALWLAGAVAYLGVLALGAHFLGGAAGEIRWGLLLSQLLGVMAGILAAMAAFASVVPGQSKAALLGAGLATIAWLAWFVALAAGEEARPVTTAQHEWICVAMILIGGTPLVAVLLAMLRKGAPMSPLLSGLLTAMAVGLLANFGACVSLPHNDPRLALVWHGGAFAVLVVLCVAGSRFVLRWRGR